MLIYVALVNSLYVLWCFINILQLIHYLYWHLIVFLNFLTINIFLGISFPAFLRHDWQIKTIYISLVQHDFFRCTTWWLNIHIHCEVITAAKVINASVASHSYYFRSILAEVILKKKVSYWVSLAFLLSRGSASLSMFQSYLQFFSVNGSYPLPVSLLVCSSFSYWFMGIFFISGRWALCPW